ncbi:hypothetical protein HYC85_013508 [Camellia sinensis]|uniref:Wall-associated receptor kinase galacturonan-binding domain-containing protein n=1 Tax=Camellia sinensis TaxID=4442 RepID=A0A7J7H5L8_CAMSI|nr:hypothetical protein HYC85_013508 [Camellia sinensis]
MFRGRLFFTAGYIATLVVHVHLLFCVNCDTNNQNQQQLLHKNSCGDIDNIGFPFRLKFDPLDTCGDKNFELECENNRTVLYLYSVKYYVQAINYSSQVISVVDAGIQRNSCSSLPPHSLTNPDVDIGAIEKATLRACWRSTTRWLMDFIFTGISIAPTNNANFRRVVPLIMLKISPALAQKIIIYTGFGPF